MVDSARYCTRWATFHHAKQLFVKFLQPTDSQKEASFCVMKLLFESPGFAILQLAFFSVSPSSRAHVIQELKTELASLSLDELAEADSGSIEPGIHPLIPLGRPLRTALVKYDPSPVDGTAASRDEKSRTMSSVTQNRLSEVTMQTRSRSLSSVGMLNTSKEGGEFPPSPAGGNVQISRPPFIQATAPLLAPSFPFLQWCINLLETKQCSSMWLGLRLWL